MAVKDRLSHETQQGGHKESPVQHLQAAIEHAAHLLPAQGPITVFIHHNTLHAFEERSFADALREGAKVFGCEPYLSKVRYRAELARGRVRFADLQLILHEDLGDQADEKIAGLCTRQEVLKHAQACAWACFSTPFAMGQRKNCSGSWRKPTRCGGFARTSRRPADRGNAPLGPARPAGSAASGRCCYTDMEGRQEQRASRAAARRCGCRRGG